MIPAAPAELYLPDAKIVALVGGGGKTTLMAAMADHAVAAGEIVIRTTTTKLAADTTIFDTEDPVFWDGRKASLPSIQTRLSRKRSLTLVRGQDITSGKLLGFAPETVDLLAVSNLADRIFVEADGARGKSIKAPAEFEPVIPRLTDLVIGILGADALGMPMDEKHVFRPERLAEISKGKPGQILDERIFACLAAHPEGLYKNAPPPCRRILYVNKMDRVGQAGWDMLRQAQRLSTATPPEGPTSTTQWFAGSVREGWLRCVGGD